MKGKIVFISVLLLLIIIIMGCSQASPPEPTATPTPTVHPGKALVNGKCVGCHDISRVTNYQSDREGWELTVDRMILLGAELNDEQREQVIDYLAAMYPEE